jgi:hypothetical protein
VNLEVLKDRLVLVSQRPAVHGDLRLELEGMKRAAELA